MAYFNHSFQKVFIGTAGNQTETSTAAGLAQGYVTSVGVPMVNLNGAYVTGRSIAPTNPKVTPAYGLFYKDTYASVGTDTSWSGATACCSLILAGSSFYENDKIGKFHGGYQETNKSKEINPKYVQNFYVVEPCTPQQAIVNIGKTPFNTAVTGVSITTGGTGYSNGTGVATTYTGDGNGLTVNVTQVANVVTAVVINNSGYGYKVGDVVTITGGGGNATLTITSVNGTSVDGECCFEFLCDETYYLRLDIKGSPALRFMNHQVYNTLDYYTGCCPSGTLAPTPVDSTLVMIGWASQIMDITRNVPYLSDFIYPVVISETVSGSTYWLYPPKTDLTALAAAPTDVVYGTWDNYVSPGHTTGECAGLVLFGAYVDTTFGNCSFQVSDFYEVEPIQIFASMVDYTGDPCKFEGLCVNRTECLGIQGNGFGETILRDLILSESYRQNFFATDIRIREITQGDNVFNVINRSTRYFRYYLLHSVPRFNNPTGVFDNDRYMLEIITNGRFTITGLVGGTGYSNGTFTNVATTGGTGTGLTVDITVAAGSVTVATINNPGTGYNVGDTLTIVGGNSDATITLASPFESTVNAWLAACAQCPELDRVSCTPCSTSVIDIPSIS